jgi:hypothetical protein
MSDGGAVQRGKGRRSADGGVLLESGGQCGLLFPQRNEGCFRKGRGPRSQPGRKGRRRSAES